jgi:tRNA(Ile)-lysidine synthase TilS/MesJ
MSTDLNYTKWKIDHKSILEDLSNKQIIMLYSGGKDCSVALYYLLLASREFGFEFETIAATYPNHIYIDTEIEKLNSYWQAQKVSIKWINPSDSDVSLSEADGRGENPCNICRAKKRSMLNNYLKEFNRNNEVVIVVSFTLWDIVSYSVEYLLGNIYHTNNKPTIRLDIVTDNRFIQTSHRFYPFLKTKDGLSVFKPMLKYNDYEIMKAVTSEGIPFSSIQCEYGKTRTKRMLFDYYRVMNLSFDYDEVFKFYENILKPYDSAFYSSLEKQDLINIL